MQTVQLGRSALRGTRLAYGCWRLAEAAGSGATQAAMEAAAERAVMAAWEAGFTLFDHADIYGLGACETLFGGVLRRNPGLRDRLLLATKCGIRRAEDPPGTPYRFDFSREYILRSCEDSLRRLGTDRVDLYQLHRPDFLMDPAEVAGAFAALRAAGKVREFGVSNFSASQVTALQRACPMPLVVNQIEFSLAHLAPLADGTLDQCLAESISPMAWSPLAGGKLGDGARRVLASQESYRTDAINHALDDIARGRETTRTAVALAWILRHPARIVPIVGSTHPERIAEAARADAVVLTREEWYRLLVVARGEPLP